MLTVSRRAEPVVSNQQQYALVVLDEEQVSQLLGRPQMRRVNALPHAYDPHARYVRLKRRVVAAVTLMLVLGTGAAIWRWVPRPAFAAVFPWSSAAPTVATAASFSVAIAAPPSADAAARVSAQLRALALPVFTRRRPNTQAHQVMVGPYVSLDEAEAAQGLLRVRGFGSGRLFVDESVRNAPRNEFRPKAGDVGPGVLLVGAPDRLSLVLELDAEPRRVYTKRASDSKLEIDIGPVAHTVRAEQWSAPEGVHLVKHVAIEEVGEASSVTGRYLRAHITLPEFTQTNVRVDGTRVYVDLTWPNTADTEMAPVAPVMAVPAREDQSIAAAAAPAAAVEAAPAVAGGYSELLSPALARFEEVSPFLLAAGKTPSPEVLQALTQTMMSIEKSLAALTPPAQGRAGHNLMMGAASAARRAMEPGFTGDRVGQVHEAIAMFERAKPQALATTAAK